jgi:hypothetical protein
VGLQSIESLNLSQIIDLDNDKVNSVKYSFATYLLYRVEYGLHTLYSNFLPGLGRLSFDNF